MPGYFVISPMGEKKKKIHRDKPEAALRSENRSENIIDLGWSQPEISWSGDWVPIQRLRLDLNSENTKS